MSISLNREILILQILSDLQHVTLLLTDMTDMWWTMEVFSNAMTSKIGYHSKALTFSILPVAIMWNGKSCNFL